MVTRIVIIHLAAAKRRQIGHCEVLTRVRTRPEEAPLLPGRRGVRDDLGGSEVGQVVLPATPGGSPAARKWQVNVPLTRNNDLPYGF